MFSASVWADVFGPEASTLDVTGSAKPTSDGRSDFLIWECPHELALGDRIEMYFVPDGLSKPRGTMFRDQVDKNATVAAFDWSSPPTGEQVRGLESRDVCNEKLYCQSC
jgi:hypothetical protein